MPKYKVTVSIRYDDTVEVEAADEYEAKRLAENEHEAKRLAADDAAANVLVCASLDVQAWDDSVKEID